MLANPLRITYAQESLILSDQTEECCCKFINLRNGEVTHFGKNGNGPNEIIAPTIELLNSSKSEYIVYAMNQGRLFRAIAFKTKE